MTGTIRAIPTRFAGVEFRSRTEARWAVVFTELGIEWHYEHEGFYAPGDTVDMYLPDFWLPDTETWVEVKGYQDALDRDARRVLAVLPSLPGALHSYGAPGARGLLLLGPVPKAPRGAVPRHWLIQADVETFVAREVTLPDFDYTPGEGCQVSGRPPGEPLGVWTYTYEAPRLIGDEEVEIPEDLTGLSDEDLRSLWACLYETFQEDRVRVRGGDTSQGVRDELRVVSIALQRVRLAAEQKGLSVDAWPTATGAATAAAAPTGAPVLRWGSRLLLRDRYDRTDDPRVTAALSTALSYRF